MNTKKLSQCIIMFVVSVLITLPTRAQNKPIQENNIKLTKFTVTGIKKKVSIDWATDNTLPTNYFEIQKSSDGLNFKTIALVLGPDPKIPEGNCYGCIDENRKSSKHIYYRLKHIDSNGAEEISETRLLATL